MFLLTDGQTVVPPVVRALGELHGRPGEDVLARRRVAGRPRAQVHGGDEHDGHHPLQQLLVRQLELVRRFDPIRQRYPLPFKKLDFKSRALYHSTAAPPLYRTK